MNADRYVVDGAETLDDPDGPLFQGDGRYAPFVIFDTLSQENLDGHFSSREAAELEIKRRFG
jgi:hypothetical protein